MASMQNRDSIVTESAPSARNKSVEKALSELRHARESIEENNRQWAIKRSAFRNAEQSLDRHREENTKKQRGEAHDATKILSTSAWLGVNEEKNSAEKWLTHDENFAARKKINTSEKLSEFITKHPKISSEAADKFTQEAVNFLLICEQPLAILQDSNVISHLTLTDDQRRLLYKKISKNGDEKTFVNALLNNEKLLAQYAPNPYMLSELCQAICPNDNSQFKGSSAQKLVDKFMKTPALVTSVDSGWRSLLQEKYRDSKHGGMIDLFANTAQQVKHHVIESWLNNSNNYLKMQKSLIREYSPSSRFFTAALSSNNVIANAEREFMRKTR